MSLIWLLILSERIYLSGVWLGVDLRKPTINTFVLNEVGLRTQIFLTILGSIFNIERIISTMIVNKMIFL